MSAEDGDYGDGHWHYRAGCSNEESSGSLLLDDDRDDDDDDDNGEFVGSRGSQQLVSDIMGFGLSRALGYLGADFAAADSAVHDHDGVDIVSTSSSSSSYT
jgi:hypothetical protein